MPSLPDIPKVELEVVGDHSAEPDGFLTLRRVELVLRTDEGTSRPVRYDMVERRALDAAVMAAHFLRSDGVPCVYLRTAVRPPVGLRAIPLPPDGEALKGGVLWELPAGLIEPGEQPSAAAARELEEELGFAKTPTDMIPLGHWAFPAPGFVGEVHFFFHVRVAPAERKAPGGDGSPLEDVARIEAIPIADALAACETGVIRDAKTELALRRLKSVLVDAP